MCTLRLCVCRPGLPLGHSPATHAPLPRGAPAGQAWGRNRRQDKEAGRGADEAQGAHRTRAAGACAGACFGSGRLWQTSPLTRDTRPVPTASRHPLQEAAKQRALRVLKQKKLYACAAALACALCLLHSPLPPPVCAVLRYEGQRDQLYQQQFNVEQTNFALASVQDTKVQVRSGVGR